MASSNSSSPPSLADIAMALLREQLNVIIHDTILSRHREHKLMLMNLDPSTKLPHCDRCGLPQLLDPPLAPKVRGATSDPPNNTQYCDKKPWCRRIGFDIYGNPFPKADVTGRPPTKKEREAAKNSQKNGTDTPASNEGGEVNGTAPPSPSQDGDAGANKAEGKLEKGEKKASKIDEKLKKGEYIPWQTCPSCKRSLLITRFAKHLEQCMGLSGRQASRNAMAKMNGNGNGIGSGAGATPAGSRGGTPAPEGKEDGEEDSDDRIKGAGEVRKKVLKKSASSKLKKDKVGGGVVNGKPVKPPPSSAGGYASFKRDRDDEDGDEEGDNMHVKKRQKLQRVESQASIASASTAPPMSAVDKNESNDGSFVDDGASIADD
jgi:hypothetical protein